MTTRSSLLQLLTRLEWVLLGTVAIAQILAGAARGMPGLTILNTVGLFAFLSLKWMIPRGAIEKLSYTVTEFGLILLLSFAGKIPLPSLLFLVLVIRNCVLLEGKARSWVAGFAFLGCLMTQTHHLATQSLLVRVPLNQIGAVWIGFILVFGLVILFLHLLVDAALKEYRGQEQLAVANARLRQYALKVEELAAEQERTRIARDIHDSLGHSLTVFGIHLEAALRLFHTNPEQAETLLKEIKQLNSQTLQDVRQSVTALRSDPLQERSLKAAIDDLVAEFARSTHITPDYEFQLQRDLSHELNAAIYRIVQESLTNVRKYAAATEVKVSIVEFAAQVKLLVQDDGKGFELSQNTTGFGLQGMQERAFALSGDLEIMALPQQGCTITATFPLQEVTHD
jgi:signal transduction histidine kinase